MALLDSLLSCWLCPRCRLSSVLTTLSAFVACVASSEEYQPHVYKIFPLKFIGCGLGVWACAQLSASPSTDVSNCSTNREFYCSGWAQVVFCCCFFFLSITWNIRDEYWRLCCWEVQTKLESRKLSFVNVRSSLVYFAHWHTHILTQSITHTHQRLLCWQRPLKFQKKDVRNILRCSRKLRDISKFEHGMASWLIKCVHLFRQKNHDASLWWKAARSLECASNWKSVVFAD